MSLTIVSAITRPSPCKDSAYMTHSINLQTPHTVSLCILNHNTSLFRRCLGGITPMVYMHTPEATPKHAWHPLSQNCHNPGRPTTCPLCTKYGSNASHPGPRLRWMRSSPPEGLRSYNRAPHPTRHHLPPRTAALTRIPRLRRKRPPQSCGSSQKERARARALTQLCANSTPRQAHRPAAAQAPCRPACVQHTAHVTPNLQRDTAREPQHTARSRQDICR